MPPTRIVITSRPLDWSPYKLAQMRRDILQMMAQEGAPNCAWEEFNLAGTPEAAPEVTYLQLSCKPCGAEWFAEKFSECPRCNRRKTVSKVVPERQKLPEGVEAGQAIVEA